MTAQSTGSPVKTEYLLDNAWQGARERLQMLEAMYDPGTLRFLEALGVGTGWHCLEVGGGGGSIAAWLCQRVGPQGRVVVSDIDTRFLEALDCPTLEVRQQNVVSDAPEGAAFDLVHARAVLAHLPKRQQALDQLVAALKPGGWLLVEEPDFLPNGEPDPRVAAADAELLAKSEHARDAMTTSRGTNLYYGRQLYGDVLARGLQDVAAEGRVPMVRGGSVEARFEQLTLGQLREPLLATGQLSATELDRLITLLDDPTYLYLGPILMAVWGRKPPE